METENNSTVLNAVEMKRRIQEQIYEETKGMSAEEVIAYFRRRVEAGPFAELWKKGLAPPAQPDTPAG